MKFKNLLLSFAAGGSLALAGGLAYRIRRRRLAELRRHRDLMESLVSLCLERLAGLSRGRVAASEAYFFIWVVERVCKRNKVEFPSFDFKARKGMLTSGKLTFILRRLLKSGKLTLEGNYLIPILLPGESGNLQSQNLSANIVIVIDETMAQWNADFPEEPLVRFGQLFKQ